MTTDTDAILPALPDRHGSRSARPFAEAGRPADRIEPDCRPPTADR
ncbi:hypothetical protein HQO42_07945 [Rhodococcus fascians]|nr:hypothetical protein [Rhodococcus fascians]MBY4237176.1 hypothetical protein [Rhodococcus fascians]MBY4252578.1 hypothetical protein [Rhodococcus fascians]MBY4268492.1 hypothetical protein [Rhodococcus fascians]